MNRIVYALGWLWIYGFVIAARVADSFGGFRYEQLSFVLIVIQLLLWVSGRVATTKVSPRDLCLMSCVRRITHFIRIIP
ncbi:hypothetical protein SK3146_06948 [Paenibacillus konkukensis]|uniref:Uncharacterized protein n=1 Tax=Paenibacillus konkukensis TaxID=2020716 RepID=A0ABY4RYA1_9BACL|nr:hypothetical protein SK3146_06948 [Paenibacillus konkukensis]